ncbi:MAG: hypothetical protein GYA62_03790, partial [Bacteroidales bacterium]|nr:hypothetical protein [Bacteroidales bacterium]
IDDTFMVVSGDVLTDVDFKDVVRYHKEKGAIATMVLTEVEDPTHFGIAVMDRDHKITEYLEKPSPEEAFSNVANTGIYIFEPEIFDFFDDKEKEVDFSKDIFPEVIKQDAGIYGYVFDGYWNDIGRPETYLEATYDILDQKTDQNFYKTKMEESIGKIGSIWVGENVFIDEIVYKIIHDQMTQISEFELGNIDILNLSTINVNRFLTDANRAKYNVHKQPKLNIYYIAFNFGKNMFSANFRKALNMAINKDELINSLMKGTMTPARGPFPPALSAYDDSLEGYKYDPVKAKELLASEKPESLKFDLYYKSSNETEDLMQMIKEDLAKIGVTINLKKMEWAALKSEIVKGNLPAYYLNWSADFPDAHNFLIPLFHTKNKGAGGNRAFFSDAALDSLMDKLESTSNADEYKALARKLQKDIVENAPWVFLWHEVEYAASQKSIQGYDVPKIYSMENFVNLKINR